MMTAEMAGSTAPRRPRSSTWAGLYVVPGFIDAHFNGNARLLADPIPLPAPSLQGVGTSALTLGSLGCVRVSLSSSKSRGVSLHRKLIFYIPFGVGDVGDSERLLDHMEQPQQQRLPPQPLQQDHPTAAAWQRQDRVMQPHPEVP